MTLRRCTIALGTAAAFACAAPTTASAACAGEATPAATGSATELRAAVVCLVNEARTARGLTPLASESRLQTAAQAHADDMRAKSYFAHQGVLGPGLGDRVTARGYDWSTVGENIAQGQRTPFEVVEAWLGSSGHCKNILGAFSDIGIGVNSGRYWVQDFGVQQGQRAGTKGGSCTTSLGRSAVEGAVAAPSPGEPAPTAGAVAGPAIRKVLAVAGSRRAVRVSVACPAGRAACTGKLRLRMSTRGAVLATKSFDVPSGGTRPVIVRVSSAAEARLRRASRRSVRLELHASGQATRARTVQLSAAR
ncbi:sporulation protein [Paraconexibacter sp. AEG42_29]|uniref:Sporulation protein n=1 Tax=Paraconexibacter sp. AEG42_29 TaxID=2997339 RepID=A0AAU7AZ20_9ACTN